MPAAAVVITRAVMVDKLRHLARKMARVACDIDRCAELATRWSAHADELSRASMVVGNWATAMDIGIDLDDEEQET